MNAKMIAISNEDVMYAKRYARHKVNTKAEMFLSLCALNLLNSAIKMHDFKQMLGNGLIKRNIARIISLAFSGTEKGTVEEFNLDSDNNCAIIKCMGVEFSFHVLPDINNLDEYIDANAQEDYFWHGMNLHVIAVPLMNIAKGMYEHSLSTADIGEFKDKIEQLVFSSYIYAECQR